MGICAIDTTGFDADSPLLTFLLTSVEFCERVRTKYLHLRLLIGRQSLVLWRLSPIWGHCGRYFVQPEKRSFRQARVFARAGRNCYAVMPADLEKYRAYVDQFDLSEAQKAELIHTVWAIMESFVDRAFGIDPVQQCLEGRAGSDSPDIGIDLDSSDQAVSEKFIQSATGGEKR